MEISPWYVFVLVLVVLLIWMVSGNSRSESLSSGAVGLDSATRLAAGGVAGPAPWAPALLNAQGYNVPFYWVPPANPFY